MENQVEITELKQLIKALVAAQEEDRKQFEESSKEVREQFKETDKKIKQAFELFESQWGKLVESLVEGDLIRILRERGIDVHDTSQRRKGHHNGHNFEFDIIAHNGNTIVIVEVKTTLRVRDVKNFLQRLRQAKTWMEEYQHFTIYGAVAFLRQDGNSDSFAENQGLFVVRATGNSASISNTPDFQPRIF
jgi:hypothetical protein